MLSHRWRVGQPRRTQSASSSARQNSDRRPIRIGMGSRPARFQFPTVFCGTPNALAVAWTSSSSGGSAGDAVLVVTAGRLLIRDSSCDLLGSLPESLFRANISLFYRTIYSKTEPLERKFRCFFPCFDDFKGGGSLHTWYLPEPSVSCTGIIFSLAIPAFRGIIFVIC